MLMLPAPTDVIGTPIVTLLVPPWMKTAEVLFEPLAPIAPVG